MNKSIAIHKIVIKSDFALIDLLAVAVMRIAGKGNGIVLSGIDQAQVATADLLDLPIGAKAIDHGIIAIGFDEGLCCSSNPDPLYAVAKWLGVERHEWFRKLSDDLRKIQGMERDGSNALTMSGFVREAAKLNPESDKLKTLLAMTMAMARACRDSFVAKENAINQLRRAATYAIGTDHRYEVVCVPDNKVPELILTDVAFSGTGQGAKVSVLVLGEGDSLKIYTRKGRIDLRQVALVLRTMSLAQKGEVAEVSLSEPGSLAGWYFDSVRGAISFVPGEFEAMSNANVAKIVKSNARPTERPGGASPAASSSSGNGGTEPVSVPKAAPTQAPPAPAHQKGGSKKGVSASPREKFERRFPPQEPQAKTQPPTELVDLASANFGGHPTEELVGALAAAPSLNGAGKHDVPAAADEAPPAPKKSGRAKKEKKD